MVPTISFPRPPADTVNIYIRVRPEELVFLNGLLESYDDLAVVKTLDPGEALAVIMVSPGREETVRSILEPLVQELGLAFIRPEGQELSRFEAAIYGLA